MLSSFLDFVHQNRLVKKGDKVLLAVSGGMDSVVMVRLFAVAGLPFAIAHCNFGLRGKESEEDQEFVKQLASTYGADFYTRKFKTTDYAKKTHCSIQEAARHLRYEWFSSLRKKYGYPSTATGHHLDDSLETFFINLLRGTGIKGLAGIQRKANGVIRPLLFASRAMIATFAEQEQLSWREDSSNDSPDYLRNRIRQQLVPVLRELQPGLSEKMFQNFSQLEFASAAYSEKVKLLRQKYVRASKGSGWVISLDKLKSEDQPTLALSALLHSLEITSKHSAAILSASQSGKVFYTGDYSLLVDRKKLLIEKSTPKSLEIVKISSKTGQIFINDRIISIETILRKGPVRFPDNPNVQLLDAAKVSFPLTLRSWHAGDAFYPLGLGHRKKLSDFLIDWKFSKFDKEKCLVLLSKGRIVCILGVQIDDRFKVTPATKEILRISS